MTQLEKAKFNDISKEMEEVAKEENINVKDLMKSRRKNSNSYFNSS
jgi:thiamine biosynthesis protein ThiC